MEMNKIVFGVCTLMELAGVAALTGIALKRNNDCYKAEKKCIDLEFEVTIAEIDKINKDFEIAELKAELEELKAESE
jgi:hypothetical protein